MTFICLFFFVILGSQLLFGGQSLDRGIPPMSSTVMVNIDVSDINDNPPTFSLANLSAVTQVNLITACYKLKHEDKNGMYSM